MCVLAILQHIANSVCLFKLVYQLFDICIDLLLFHVFDYMILSCWSILYIDSLYYSDINTNITIIHHITSLYLLHYILLLFYHIYININTIYHYITIISTYEHVNI